jgi:hypothetical protein
MPRSFKFTPNLLRAFLSLKELLHTTLLEDTGLSPACRPGLRGALRAPLIWLLFNGRHSTAKADYTGRPVELRIERAVF